MNSKNIHNKIDKVANNAKDLSDRAGDQVRDVVAKGGDLFDSAVDWSSQAATKTAHTVQETVQAAVHGAHEWATKAGNTAQETVQAAANDADELATKAKHAGSELVDDARDGHRKD